MKTIGIILDFLALIIQIIGTIIMFLNSPENRITGAMMGGNYDKDIPKRKNKRLRNGFLILTIGILVSIISLVIKDFLVQNDI